MLFINKLYTKVINLQLYMLTYKFFFALNFSSNIFKKEISFASRTITLLPICSLTLNMYLKNYENYDLSALVWQ